MAKACPDAIMDLMLTGIAGATAIYVLTGEPANFAGIAALLLVSHVTAGGDFAIADDGSAGGGRKVTVAQQTDLAITNSGNATHIALAVTGTNTLVYVTTCTLQALVNTGTVTIPAFKIQIADPV